MHQKPFLVLKQPRSVNRPDLPSDLVEFYSRHEGIGLESSPERIVRLCKLDEVRRVAWRDLYVLGASKAPPGWETFAALRVGISSFFEEIVYVLSAPSCSRGSILALGPDYAHLGGSGPNALEGSLVLASSFGEWLAHMERMSWEEYGLTPGGIADLTPEQRAEVRQYYERLNPLIEWGSTHEQ
jgi:hypothetical protein